MAPMQAYNTIAPPGYDAAASSVSFPRSAARKQEAGFVEAWKFSSVKGGPKICLLYAKALWCRWCHSLWYNGACSHAALP